MYITPKFLMFCLLRTFYGKWAIAWHPYGVFNIAFWTFCEVLHIYVSSDCYNYVTIVLFILFLILKFTYLALGHHVPILCSFQRNHWKCLHIAVKPLRASKLISIFSLFWISCTLNEIRIVIYIVNYHIRIIVILIVRVLYNILI